MRIKRTLQPYLSGDKITFGFGNHGLERHIPKSELAMDLIKKLDTPVELSNLSEQEQLLVASWEKQGLLTNNSYDDAKYSRNINFYEWVDCTSNLDPSRYQEKLASSSILLVGVGGIGATVAEILARLGIGKLIIVDYDVVENSNLTRQSGFTKKDIGKTKVSVVAQYIKAISDTQVVSLQEKIETAQDLDNLFATNTFDLAICCADTPKLEIDYWFDTVAHKYQIPFIVGSYASTVINYLHIVPNKTVSVKEFYERYMIDDEHLLDSQVPYGVIAPVSYMAAAIIAYKVLDSLTGLLGLSDYLQLDVLDWRVYRYEIDKV